MMKHTLGPSIGLIALGILGWQWHELGTLKAEATALRTLVNDLEGRLAEHPSDQASGTGSPAPTATRARAPEEPLTPKGTHEQRVPPKRPLDHETGAPSEEDLDAAVERVLERQNTARQEQSIEDRMDESLGYLMLKLDTLEEEGVLAEDEALAVENLTRDFAVAVGEVLKEAEGNRKKIGYGMGFLREGLIEDMSRALGDERAELVFMRLGL
jgi:hypothetical protein